MRWHRIAAMVIILATGMASAHADDASRLKAARQIVETSHAADHVRALLPMLQQQMRPMMLASGADAKAVDDFLKAFNQRLDQEVDKFTDLAAQIYAREFSEDDLNNLLAFYNTPTGQRMLGKQTEIAQAMMQAGQQWGQMMAQEVLTEFKNRKESGASKL